MTVVDTTDTAQNRDVTFEIELRHAPEKVWRAITDPVLLAEWLLPAINFKLEKGAQFTLKTQPVGGWDGTVDCKMLDIEQGKKLSYNWVVGDIDTVVTFTLTPTSAGTKLSLVQSGFKPGQKQNWAGARYGLKMMGQKLVDVLDRL